MIPESAPMTPPITLRLEPNSVDIQCAPGTLLDEALRSAGIEFAYPCGGNRFCGQCRVTFETGAPAPSPEETKLLSYPEIESGVRLACCAAPDRDAVIRLPGIEEVQIEHILREGIKTDIVVDPEVRKYRCELPPSTLEKPLSDWSRVSACLPEKIRAQARPTLHALQKMPALVQCAAEGGKPVTITLRAERVLDVECGDHAAEHFGVAVDLGTTTIAATLVDMHTGAELAHAGCMNPQRSFGFDLISRIHAVQEAPENLDLLHDRVIESIGGLIARMCAERGIKTDKVVSMALAGNTAMSHLFLRIDPRPLGHAPFAGTLRAGVRLEARDLALPIHPHAPVYVLPCIGGFVGGDIVAGALMANLEKLPGVSVFVDIGTNGEVVVADHGRLFATSCAAGPAFEGGKIRCGMIARDGAVHRVTFDGQDLALETLGGKPPVGICGSGLIEAFARGAETGLIQMNGRLAQPGKTAGTVPEKLALRLRDDGEDGLRIHLANDGGQGEIFISQADVREFQLCKGAVQTAILMVLKEMNLKLEQIDRFLVAGAFGNHLNVGDAIALGLLPGLPLEKIHFIGNSSLEGARCVLLNRYDMQRAEKIAEEAAFVELATRPEFQEHFAMAMMLCPAMDF